MECWLNTNEEDDLFGIQNFVLESYQISTEGVLTLQNTYTRSFPLRRLRPVDFNQDGWLDLISKKAILWNDGTGTLMDVELVQGLSSLEVVYPVNYVDFDLDDDVDIAYRHEFVELGGGDFRVAINDGQGAIERIVSTGNDSVRFFSLQDLSGDARLELLDHNTSNNVFTIYRTEDESLEKLYEFTLFNEMPFWSSKSSVFDFDLDGDMDILFGNSLVKNLGNDNFDLSTLHSNTAHKQLAADFTGDGKTDIIYFVNGQLILYENVFSITQQSEDLYFQGFELFPNPSGDFCHVNLPKDLTDPCTFEVFAQTGQLILSQKIIGEGLIDCRSLPNGLYFFRISKHTLKSKPKKLVISKASN